MNLTASAQIADPEAEERPIDGAEADAEAPLTREPAGVGELAVRLAKALDAGDLVFLAADDVRARAVERALRAAAPDAAVVHLPASDALPGDAAPPSPGNAGLRVAAFHRLATLQAATPRPPIALVTTGEATARLYPAPATFDAAPPVVRVGDVVDLEALVRSLEALGYVADDTVDEPGEIALRGQVADLFPADAVRPFRIEVADGRVASLRVYDPATQLTVDDADAIEVGRVAEPELGDGVSLLDHLPGAAIATDVGAEERRTRFLALAADAAERRPARAVRDVCGDKAWKAAVKGRAVSEMAAGAGDAPPRFVEGKSPTRAFAAFARAASAAGDRLVLLGSPRDLRFLGRRVAKTLKSPPVEAGSWREALAAPPGSVLTLAMPAERGFRAEGVVAVAAADLLGSRAESDAGDPAPADAQPFASGDIRIGDVVVHEDHGIGVVAGVEATPSIDSAEADGGDAIVLRYADDARRLVPVADADRIWRYGADADAVTLDRLDGASWEKRRGAIDAAVAESARALTALAAERAGRTAVVLDPDPSAYERFAAGFQFTETADQARAIAAVRHDLASGEPMDRLVIGDVGYGKTEVALRAAALAALAGRQVAIVAPTTVLARQHLETFTDRFRGTGIGVAGLSRLSSPAEKRAAKAGLADGSVGIVVGTGAVAGRGVAFKNLALVVIDEEQRFGAADKNRLRALAAGEMGASEGGAGDAGHVLTLSATPIPRTLQAALVGLQRMSVIATPPARRQPIRTVVEPFDPATVRTALLRERGRGGQSFVVVPRIEDMAWLAEQLAKTVPELEVLQAHGKMPADAVDAAMVGFASGDGDVLLATNIIEAGLDVPRANTMLVWRADRFGLSQLHQLRGRVGRGGRRGRIHLLTDPETEIAPRTLARLRTLQAHDRLGAGFAISARDLDMRGAGDLLGDEQAGHMKLIGIDLYQHLLAGALRRARGETADVWTPELHIGVEGRLPEAWIPEAEARVTLYARLARIADEGELDAFADELADRFGEPPPEAETLLAAAGVRLLARRAAVGRIDAGPGAVALTARAGFSREAAARAGLAEKNGRWILAERIEDPHARRERVGTLLRELLD